MRISNAISVGFGTDVGRVRERNEDAYYVVPSTLSADLRARKGELYLVADGVGGYRGGARASQLAAALIPQEYYKDPDPNVEQSLNRALQRANRLIHQEAQVSPDRAHMGTTVVAAVIRGPDLIVANVGDSRAYLLRGREIQQITRDHSLVSEGLASGLITKQNARRHPLLSTITRALGAAPEVKADFFRLRLQPGDRILLCTDGLSNEVSNAELRALASRAKPQEAVDEMIQAANERGGRDNITAVLLEVRRLEGVRAAKPAPKANRVVLAAAGGVLALLLVGGGLWAILREKPPSPMPQGLAISPSPSPTASATPTASPTPTPTLRVNLSAIATVPPTDTPTPTPVPTPTNTPTPTRTPTPTPTKTRVPAPTLVEPRKDSIVIGRRVSLKWKPLVGWTGGYQVTVWRGDPDSGSAEVVDKAYEKDTEREETLELEDEDRFCWQVVAALGEGEEEVVGQESEKWCFQVQKPPPTR